jgi:hypothetical protein
VAAAIFAHTGTLGVRWSRMNRLTASRTSVEVEVGPQAWGLMQNDRFWIVLLWEQDRAPLRSTASVTS